MTLEELRQLDCINLTPAQAAAVIGTDPNTLRWQARDNPLLLGFPVIVVKSRCYIPRLPFIQYMTSLPGAEPSAVAQ